MSRGHDSGVVTPSWTTTTTTTTTTSRRRDRRRGGSFSSSLTASSSIRDKNNGGGNNRVGGGGMGPLPAASVGRSVFVAIFVATLIALAAGVDASSTATTTTSTTTTTASDDGNDGGGGDNTNPAVALALYLKDSAVDTARGFGQLYRNHQQCNFIRQKLRLRHAELQNGWRRRDPSLTSGQIRERLRSPEYANAGISFDEYVFLQKGRDDRSKVVSLSFLMFGAPRFLPYALMFNPDLLPSPFQKNRLEKEKSMLTLGGDDYYPSSPSSRGAPPSPYDDGEYYDGGGAADYDAAEEEESVYVKQCRERSSTLIQMLLSMENNARTVPGLAKYNIFGKKKQRRQIENAVRLNDRASNFLLTTPIGSSPNRYPPLASSSSSSSSAARVRGGTGGVNPAPSTVATGGLHNSSIEGARKLLRSLEQYTYRYGIKTVAVTGEEEDGDGDGKKKKKKKKKNDGDDENDFTRSEKRLSHVPIAIVRGIGNAATGNTGGGFLSSVTPNFVFRGRLIKHLKMVQDADDFLVYNRVDLRGIDKYLLYEACSDRCIGNVRYSEYELRQLLQDWLQLTVREPAARLRRYANSETTTLHHNGNVARTALMGYYGLQATRDPRSTSILPRLLYTGGGGTMGGRPSSSSSSSQSAPSTYTSPTATSPPTITSPAVPGAAPTDDDDDAGSRGGLKKLFRKS